MNKIIQIYFLPTGRPRPNKFDFSYSYIAIKFIICWSIRAIDDLSVEKKQMLTPFHLRGGTKNNYVEELTITW